MEGHGAFNRTYSRVPVAMMQSSKRADTRSGGWIAIAAISGAVSVVAGAFAAHGLDPQADSRAIGWMHTGSLHQMMHALAILATVALSGARLLAARAARIARWLFLVGIIVFPTALYGLALHGPRWLGAVAPIGGAAMILGWIALAVAAITAPKT